MTTILEDYGARIAAGQLRKDEAQLAALTALHGLAEQIRLQPEQKTGFFARLRRTAAVPIRGLYLFGPVGRGKSMLMDLFFTHVALTAKRRVHFHVFMQEVHKALHAWRQRTDHGDDPLPQIARQIAEQHHLLCFDEFQVTDIADAMILARLFEALFAEGVILVATSNTEPDELYKSGLQRANFLPFIAVLKAHVNVMEVAGGTDHRMAVLRGHPVYFTPLNAASSAALTELFVALTGNAASEPVTLPVQGRELTFNRAAHDVLWTSFTELCQRPLGAADYLAMAARFRAVVLENMPQFRADQRNEVMRFITFVDALYEAKVKLLMAAQVPPEALYPAGLHAVMFHRTASRLNEMQGAAYLALPHQENMKKP